MFNICRRGFVFRTYLPPVVNVDLLALLLLFCSTFQMMEKGTPIKNRLCDSNKELMSYDSGAESYIIAGPRDPLWVHEQGDAHFDRAWFHQMQQKTCFIHEQERWILCKNIFLTRYIKTLSTSAGNLNFEQEYFLHTSHVPNGPRYIKRDLNMPSNISRNPRKNLKIFTTSLSAHFMPYYCIIGVSK